VSDDSIASETAVVSRRELLAEMGVFAAAAAASVLGRASTAASRPREVLLIRHAEEPDRGTSVDLNEQGRRRAAALVTLFPSRFTPPRFLFAARPTKHTSRSVETLEPLSRALHLPIDQSFDEEQYAHLARTLRLPAYADAHVLVCWQHSSMPELAEALGVTAPPRWSDKRYDRIWQITYGAAGPVLTDLPQSLLADDSR
jgi:hypothetical protein